MTQAALLLKNEIDLRVESLKAELDRLRAAQFCAIDDQIRLLSTHSLQKIKEMRHNKEIAENIEQEIDKKELVVKVKQVYFVGFFIKCLNFSSNTRIPILRLMKKLRFFGSSSCQMHFCRALNGNY